MDHARSHLNRIIVVSALLVVLPLLAIAERLRRGWGRAFAVRAIRRTGRLCGVTFDVRSSGSVVEEGSCVLVPKHTSPLVIAAVLAARSDVTCVDDTASIRLVTHLTPTRS